MTMDRLKKAARAAGYVMAGLEHDSCDPAHAEAIVAKVRAASLPTPPRPLLIAGPATGRSSVPTLWNWFGGLGRGAPA